jgi:hypothetical protein
MNKRCGRDQVFLRRLSGIYTCVGRGYGGKEQTLLAIAGSLNTNCSSWQSRYKRSTQSSTNNHQPRLSSILLRCTVQARKNLALRMINRQPP